jgi:hypothetical protein
VPDLGDLGGGGDSGSGDSGAGSSPADDVRDALPGVGDILDGLPGVGKNGLDLKQQLRANGSAGGSAASSTEAAGDLLNFLLAD